MRLFKLASAAVLAALVVASLVSEPVKAVQPPIPVPAPVVPSIAVANPGAGNIATGFTSVTVGYSGFAANQWINVEVIDITGAPVTVDFDAQLSGTGSGYVTTVAFKLAANRTYRIRASSSGTDTDSVVVTTGP